MVLEIKEKIKSKENEILKRQEDVVQLERQNNVSRPSLLLISYLISINPFGIDYHCWTQTQAGSRRQLSLLQSQETGCISPRLSQITEQ